MRPKIRMFADQILCGSYEEQGSVEGILERIDTQDGTPFVIYDVIDQHAIKCEVTDFLLWQALENFQKRVEVIGTVQHTKHGVPVSIKATRLISFPEKSEIPTLAQMRALFAGEITS